jgi:ABC-type multidrug transport system fused ATPase/permease subunit
MFEGTLRDNLDPRHVHDDTELWSVLGKSSLHLDFAPQRTITDRLVL